MRIAPQLGTLPTGCEVLSKGGNSTRTDAIDELRATDCCRELSADEETREEIADEMVVFDEGADEIAIFDETADEEGVVSATERSDDGELGNGRSGR